MNRALVKLCLLPISVLLGLGCTDPGSDASNGTTGESTEADSTGTAEATTTLESSTGGEATDSTGGEELPFSRCAGDSVSHRVLNAYWTEFDRRYALFDIRLPDRTWSAVGHQACAEVSADMPEGALFDLLVTMAETLDDGHVQLEAPSLGRSADGWVSEYPYYDELFELELGIEDNYLDAPLTWAANDWFAWGSVGSIGYISITSFDELSATGDEDDDMAAADAAMAMALADLGASTGLVIDVRANEGGWDCAGLAVARHVAGDEALVWSKARRNGPAHDDFSPWEDARVGPALTEAYGGPVVVLTSGGTFSAAETFVLAMRVRDNVTVLGEPTSGHFSDLFDADLPNGWSYTYSGERYRAADGMIYEAIGAPVDLAVALDVNALASGQDIQLEAALVRLGG